MEKERKNIKSGIRDDEKEVGLQMWIKKTQDKMLNLRMEKKLKISMKKWDYR